MPGRPVAFIIHELAPYRLHTLKRLAEGIPACPFHAVLTSAAGGFNWTLDWPEAVQRHDLSEGSRIAEQGHLSRIFAERAKGRKMLQKLLAIGPAAVVICGYADAAHRMAIDWCDRQQVPALLWADSNILSEHSRQRPLRRLIKPWLLRPLLGRCSAVLPWGTLGRQYVLKYGVPQDRIFVVSPEPDYRLIEAPDAATIAETRAQLKLAPERKRILYVGRLAAEKRVDLLLWAFARIAAERPDWDLLIVGDGPLRDSLQALVPQALKTRVTWAGAKTTPQSLAPLYHLGNLFVLPSDHEPWGVVVNEAAAAGLPLICSDIVGAAADLLKQSINGRLFRHGDASDLGRQIALLTAEPDLGAMGARSREILAQWRTMADPVTGMRNALKFCGVA